MEKFSISKLPYESLIFLISIILMLLAVLQTIPDKGSNITFNDKLTVVQIVIFSVGLLLCITSIYIYYNNRNKKINKKVKERVKSVTNLDAKFVEKIDDDDLVMIEQRFTKESLISKRDLNQLLEEIVYPKKKNTSKIYLSDSQKAILLVIYVYAPLEEYDVEAFHKYFIKFLETSNKDTEELKQGHISYKSSFLVKDFEEFYFRLKDLAYHFDIPLITLKKFQVKRSRLKRINAINQGFNDIGFINDSLLE